MKTKTTLLALLLTLSSAWVLAQNPNPNQSATTPDPQTVPEHSGNSASPSGSSTVALPSGDQSSNAALQARIQEALRNEPTLSSSRIIVNLTDNAIDLAGTVGSSKDKQTAERLAQSFDGNRQIKDSLVITGHGHSDVTPQHPAMNNGGTGDAGNSAINQQTNESSNSPRQQ